jgi:hypothetical protein
MWLSFKIGSRGGRCPQSLGRSLLPEETGAILDASEQFQVPLGKRDLLIGQSWRGALSVAKHGDGVW